MKISEMNGNQLEVYRMVCEECDAYIGGWENQMDDTREGSEGWLEAKSMLECGHEAIVEYIYNVVKSSWKWQRIENLHFVSLEWMRERINKRIRKMGY